MITIDVKLNGKVIATADLTNLSDLAEVSDYAMFWAEDDATDLGIPESSGRAMIRGHRRRQSVWALVAKAVATILGAMADDLNERPGQARIWDQTGRDYK